jgi:hypothetical protein
MGDELLNGGAMSEPDLTAELDAAGDIVTGRAEAVVTEWGFELPGSPVQVLSYGTGEGIARNVARYHEGTLVRRTVTYGPWEEAGDG